VIKFLNVINNFLKSFPKNNHSNKNSSEISSNKKMSKKAIIIGAGPAGLTAAYELLEKSDIQPIIIEMSDCVGGISRTINYKGNRMDIGGHRFFSKSDVVMDWWLKILPIEKHQAVKDEALVISYQNKTKSIIPDQIADPSEEDKDKVMLVRNRLSRIFYLKKFFDYPLSLNFKTINNLSLVKTFKILISYLKARVSPIKNEKSLEDFFINRFGYELYNTFFKDYTEKVWGIECKKISAEWGKQRIKGISISKVLLDAIKKVYNTTKSDDFKQKGKETSLIEKFLYPKYGPGQLWEEVARIVTEKGGKIIYNHEIKEIFHTNGSVSSVVAENQITKEKLFLEGDYFISTMPVKDLVGGFSPAVPKDVADIASGLLYRDFITVGLLLDKLTISDKNGPIKDNWIYIQEKEVKLGRLQVFNNWSPFMVADPGKTWLGLEYFCNEGDDLWNKTDKNFLQFAIEELESIGIIDQKDVRDGVVVRVPKTYPAYFGAYERFDEVKDYLNQFPNLFLVGRNGMHKYNNQDHSMLTAIAAVDNIINGKLTKDNLWEINTEQEYHEEVDKK
jgi:protoporphyrinogen oxidase